MRDRKKKYRRGSAKKKQTEQTSQSFPFIDHDQTVNHVRRSKVIFAMRGLPGSGKSTLVRQIKSKYRRATVCSADDFFLQDGQYLFDRDKLSEAHQYCQTLASESCAKGRHVVIIDNTNVCRWEMKYYQKLAKEHAYLFIPVLPGTPWSFDPSTLASLNKHSVSQEIIEKKVQQFQKMDPVFWGWFLDEKASDKLLDIGSRYLKLCVEKIPEFASLFEGKADSDWVSLSGYYSRWYTTDKFFHCTAFYGGKGKAPGAAEYEAREDVKLAMNKAYALKCIGFFFTPRTAGVRVALSSNQLHLWGKDDYEGVARPPAAGGQSDTDTLCEQLAAASVGLRKSPGIKSPGGSRFQPTKGLGSRAHLTLGTAADVQPVQTGLDLINIIDKEEAMPDAETIHVDGDAIRYYGKECCVVYLDQPFTESTLFAAQY